MESDRFNITDFKKVAEIRVKNLFAQATQAWTCTSRTTLIIIDCKDGFRYIVTGRINPFIVKYKQRKNGWKWVSHEDIMGVETMAENVSSPSLRKGSLALRFIFNKIIPYSK